MIELLKETAFQAGKIALADMERLSIENIHNKSNVLDLVTDTDRKVEEFIVSRLKKHFPAYGIYGEETGKDHADSEYCFIIDPIDGTASFTHKLPNWGISIGLTRNGQVIAGVIYQPVMDKLYYAERGKGSYCNGRKLACSNRARLCDAIAVTGFYCLREGWKEENNLRYFSRIAPHLCDIRKFGSAAVDCCKVAEGIIDFYWELCLQPYDMTAGAIIASEAGALVTDLHGGNNYPAMGLLISNVPLQKEVLPFFTDFQALHR